MSVLFKRVTALLVFVWVSVGVQAVELSTQDQKFSYVLGYQFGQQLKSEGIKVDSAAFAAAIDDVFWGKPLQMSAEEMRAALQAGQQALAEQKQIQAAAAQDAGRKFLEQNSKEAGVVVLPSGIQYIELQAGEGESPAPDSKVTVHYRGTLINGREFDSSYKRGTPASFALNGVIPGFRESITQMKPGAKWKVFIPSEMGYGTKGAGANIGPNETLIFEIELINVE